MRTVGVDLAAEARGTAIATVDWFDDGTARVVDVVVGAEDDQVLTAITAADKAAVDCPLGWPEPFIDFLLAHRTGQITVPRSPTGLAWRRTLSRRATDLECERLTGVRPLSVAADRIAAVAMRGAALQAALATAGRPVDRTGAGQLIETYPAAALRYWRLPHQGYKGAAKAAVLAQLVDELSAAAPLLALGPADQLCRKRDDAVDAVLCAMMALAAALGLGSTPPPRLRALAAREGWIVLPNAPLSAVVAGRLPPT